MEMNTSSLKQTQDFARTLAQRGLFHRNQVVLLNGQMGAGKTSFVAGVLSGLGYQEEVLSPTFALCHRYHVGFDVLHYDLYRLHGYDDLYSIGFFDDVDSGALVLIEWAENAGDCLQDLHPAVITITRTGDTQRHITLTNLQEEAL